MQEKRNIAFFSIKRPIFIASITALLIIVGLVSYKSMGIDFLPDVDPAAFYILTQYKGASPEEVEKLVTKPIEDEVSSIAGLKSLTSTNYEGMSIVNVEFVLGTEMRTVEQQLRDKVAAARPKLPEDIEEPLFYKRDTSSMAIMRVSLQSDLPPTQAYDLAYEDIRLKLQQVSNVGDIELIGGQKREIQVELDREKLNSFRISASTVVNQLKSAGTNVPAGKFEKNRSETVFRTVGEFDELNPIGDSVVLFSGDVANSVTIKNLGRVLDGTEDALTTGYIYYPYKTVMKKSDGFFGGFSKPKPVEVRTNDTATRPAVFLDIYKQSGTNTVAVADGIKAKIEAINKKMENQPGKPKLIVVSDYSKIIRDNVDDVVSTIIFGIILAIITVYLFLGNARSTIITGVSIPTSLLGAFILMYLFGFTINLMSLMALSLAVGLLIDDAIVIQENIYRKREAKMHPFAASEFGTEEVKLAVIATTLVVISVFLPIGFLRGQAGGYFRPFGFSIVFAMAISLMAALTIAPLLNAYFGGKGGKNRNIIVNKFDKFQDRIDQLYEKIISFTLSHPLSIIAVTFLIFVASVFFLRYVPMTNQPEGDSGQFNISLELPTQTSLEGTHALVDKIEPRLKAMKEIKFYTISIGNTRGESNKATISINCVPRDERSIDTNGMKQRVRAAVKEFSYANPAITNPWGGGGGRPYQLNISGNNLADLDVFSKQAVEALKKIPDLTEITTNYRPGKPEFQIKLDPLKMAMLGVQPKAVGDELRTYIAGTVVAKLHQNGLEYDIRVRLKPDQRNVKESYPFIRVPNTQNKMIPLNMISKPKEVTGPSLIMRQDRERVIQISANLVPGGALGNATAKTDKILGKLPNPNGVHHQFVGSSKDFAELVSSIVTALIFALLLIYFVLSSLYDSFITPITILLAILPAMTGAFGALFIARLFGSNVMFDMFSMIGIITLLGLVIKNSILLVDFALEGLRAGMTQKEAIKRAGIVRLRPILMTSVAIIAGTLPLALGVGEAAAYRKSMGIVIIGGVLFSTLVTLVMVPAMFEYVDRFRGFVERITLSKEMVIASAELNKSDAKELIGDKLSHAELVCKPKKKTRK